MWAVVNIGAKQYKVKEGDVLEVERIKDKSPLTLDKVLLLYNKKLNIGKPYVKGASIEAEVLQEVKDKKVIVFKYKRRKSYKKTQGHRQIKAHLKILKITSS